MTTLLAQSRFLSARRSASAAACAVLLTGLSGCVVTFSDKAETPVPAALDAGPNTRLLGTLSASGVQIYECRQDVSAVAPAWVFVAPEAELFDQHGRPAGTHGAGPFWLSVNGSRVVGTVRARADAPQPDAIPWLLLATQSTGGQGVLSAVTYIQRVRTEGGVVPVGGCAAANLGQRVRMPYRADYRLFTSI
ncbi:MAG: DUF3455 domain-containing protein [Rhodocyclaceae bacterium]